MRIFKRLESYDCSSTVGTYADNLDRCCKFLFKISNVVLKCFGEVLFLAEVREGSLPTGNFFVNSLPTFSVVGHGSGAFAVLFVGYAYLNCVETVEHVTLHHYEVGNAVDHNGILEGYEVHPTATAVTACYSTVLVTNVADEVACFVKEFNGEGT